MPEIYTDVDAAGVTLPVNVAPLIDDTDFKSREVAIAYDAAGMDLVWNFITAAGVITQTAVTPTTAGVYDWAHVGDGMYKIEFPATGGTAGAMNDTEGMGWFSGICTGVLPWRGPIIGFRRAALNDLLMDGSSASTNLEDFFDGTGYAGGTAKLAVNVAAQDNIDFGALQKVSLNAATPASIQSYGTLVADTATAVWAALTSGMATVGSIGKKLADWVVGTIDTYTGNTKQTGDVFPIASNGTYGNSALNTDLDAVLARIPAALTAGGSLKASIEEIKATALTEGGAGRLAAAFIKLLDVATPLLIADAAMRGTDSAALASAWTAQRAGYVDNLSAGAVATSANQTTILARLGAWTGTGINSILGALRALAGKTAALTPTDITAAALTYDNTTDSLEALRDTAPMGTVMRGTDSAALAATALSNLTWTDAKAGYLTGIVALEASLTDMKGVGWATETLVAIKAYVDDLESRLTAARAGYLDKLNIAGIIAQTGADSDTLKTLSDQIDGVAAGSGLTAQETRDAMKLAPTVGAPAAGSVDDHLDATALEATLTAIKGAGWATETLAAIDVLIDAIKAKTDNLPASPAAVGSAMTLEDNAITAAKIAADAIGSSELAASAVTEIQNGLTPDAGAVTWTITVHDSLGANDTAAQVWLTSDAAGATMLRAPKNTNDAGQVVFHLDAGVTYWIQGLGGDGEELIAVSFVAA